MNLTLLCLACVGSYIEQKSKENPEGYRLSAEELYANCNVAVTLAPTWQQLQLGGGNMVMGCAAVPTCPIHIGNQTPEQSGRSNSGLLVPGGMN